MLFGCNGRERACGKTRMLLRSMLLQVFYSVGSERRLEFDLLFCWFVGL